MIIIDDSYKQISAYTRGRKEKEWLEKDNKRYLYKFGASNYEIFAETIAEQLGKQVGINMASYKIAKMKNSYGVITESFLKPGELIISSDKLKLAVQSIYEENNLTGNLKANTISNLVEAAFTYDSTINSSALFDELIKRWMFSGLIMESDKNDTNISFIKSENKLKLSPDYDNSTMCRLNENVENLVSKVRSNADMYKLTDGIQNALKPTERNSDNFLVAFQEFSEKYSEKAIQIFSKFESINVNNAIKTVEQINGVNVPWAVSYFVEKAINLRYIDMKNIINRYSKSIHK